MVRQTVLCIAVLTASTGESVVAQHPIDAGRPDRYQERAPVTPEPPPHRRLEVASGITLLNIRKLPPDDRVGGWPAGLFVSAGYNWTRHLVTQIEAASQVGDAYFDYAREELLVARPGGRFDLTTVSLQRHYDAGRRSVAQLFQFGAGRFRPYVGAGVGVETQTVRHGRLEYTRPLQSGQAPPGDARTVGELPTELPVPATTRHAIAFAQAGLKVSVTQRAHVLVDWKFARTGPPRFRLGVGLGVF